MDCQRLAFLTFTKLCGSDCQILRSCTLLLSFYLYHLCTCFISSSCRRSKERAVQQDARPCTRDRTPTLPYRRGAYGLVLYIAFKMHTRQQTYVETARTLLWQRRRTSSVGLPTSNRFLFIVGKASMRCPFASKISRSNFESSSTAVIFKNSFANRFPGHMWVPELTRS